jgi:hypothetical protein
VDGDELAGAGLAGLEFVESHPAFLVGLEDPSHCGLVLSGEGGVNQADGGAARDTDADPDDVCRDAQRNDGVEALPACEGYCGHADDDTDGGPDIS